MEGMSPNTIELLKKAGWYEGRNIEIENVVEILTERGFEVFPPVREFLKQFGMLEIKSPMYPQLVSSEDIKKSNFKEYYEHTTDVYSALGDCIDISYSQQFEYYAKEKLVIVGIITNRNLDLMISESGKVYCDSGKLGDTFEEAWETIFGYKKLVPWWLL